LHAMHANGAQVTRDVIHNWDDEHSHPRRPGLTRSIAMDPDFYWIETVPA